MTGRFPRRLPQAAARLALAPPRTCLHLCPRRLRRSPRPQGSTGSGWGRRPIAPSGGEALVAPLPGGRGDPGGPVALPVIMRGRLRAAGQSPSREGRRAAGEPSYFSPSADVPSVPRLG